MFVVITISTAVIKDKKVRSTHMCLGNTWDVRFMSLTHEQSSGEEAKLLYIHA